MERDDFLRRHPRLFHLADADALPSLTEHGLLCVRELAERSGMSGEDLHTFLTTHRAEQQRLDVPGFGSVVLRDQRPLVMTRLPRLLTGGMTAEDYLELLNSYVFLFPDRTTLETLATRYGDQPNLVLEIDTRSLLDEYGALVRLTSINTGATVFVPAPRGRESFLGVGQFPARKKVKEVALERGLPDLRRHLLSAEIWLPDGTRRPA